MIFNSVMSKDVNIFHGLSEIEKNLKISKNLLSEINHQATGLGKLIPKYADSTSSILRQLRNLFSLKQGFVPESLLSAVDSLASNLASIFSGILDQNKPQELKQGSPTLESKQGEYMSTLNKQLIDLARQHDNSAKVPSVEYSKMKMVNNQMKIEFEKMNHLKIEKA